MSKSLWKQLEEAITTATVVSTSRGLALMELVKKYHVPSERNDEGLIVYAGCPGVMNYKEEGPVELRWGSGFHNADKCGRYIQLEMALTTIDKGVCIKDDGSFKEFISMFENLDIHGRVMFFNIASLQEPALADYLIELAIPYSTHGVSMATLPYGKGTGTVGAIFDHYITPYAPMFTLGHELLNQLNNLELIIDEENFFDVVTQVFNPLDIKISTIYELALVGQYIAAMQSEVALVNPILNAQLNQMKEITASEVYALISTLNSLSRIDDDMLEQALIDARGTPTGDSHLFGTEAAEGICGVACLDFNNIDLTGEI